MTMTIEKKDINILANRAVCMSRIHHYCNEVVPELLKELEKGFKITVNHQFHKKDEERFKAILDNQEKTTSYKNPLRAYIEVNEFSIILNVDTHYQVSEHGCSYYKQYAYLYNRQSSPHYNIEPKCYEYTPKEMITEQELIDATAKKRETEDKISELKSKLSSLNLLLE